MSGALRQRCLIHRAPVGRRRNPRRMGRQPLPPSRSGSSEEHFEAAMAETRLYIRTVLCDDPAVGLDLSDTFPTLPTQLVTPPEQVPVVLFEPEMTMWVDMEDGSRREAQSDAAVSAGLHRCWPGPTPPDPSPGWSVRHTAAGIDLVLGSSVWATGATSPDLGWLELAGAHQQVLALYGTRLGVRIPRKLESARYTPDLRRRELDDARRDGDVAY